MAIDPGVDIGHVHLKVAELDPAIAFYRDVLGFELMQRMGDQAAFLSAGGYHHHIGLNTWAGEGAPHPPPGARGLRRYELLIEEEDRLDELERALTGAGVGANRTPEGIETTDPSGNRILLRSKPG